MAGPSFQSRRYLPNNSSAPRPKCDPRKQSTSAFQSVKNDSSPTRGRRRGRVDSTPHPAGGRFASRAASETRKRSRLPRRYRKELRPIKTPPHSPFAARSRFNWTPCTGDNRPAKMATGGGCGHRRVQDSGVWPEATSSFTRPAPVSRRGPRPRLGGASDAALAPAPPAKTAVRRRPPKLWPGALGRSLRRRRASP